MIKKILIVAAVLLTAVMVLAATKPATFHVERTVRINAPPEKVFPLINDFHNWESWSPWEKLDPAMKRTHSGAANGKGAVYAWAGIRQYGQSGRQGFRNRSRQHEGHRRKVKGIVGARRHRVLATEPRP